ncbi:MAG: DegT/DnrJ/EryC1/StrS family aminotransferase [Myxococcota bacterium]|nr:DegT/DnrJ/EryC1/StrS family aminotransferase [Myxococcota bacterium]
MSDSEREKETGSVSGDASPDPGEALIHVARPLLPSVAELTPLLEDIFSGAWVTNNGRYLQQLEEQVADFLDCPRASVVSNGTVALELAVAALLGLDGPGEGEAEVITTGFSFPATWHVLLYQAGVKPVFADIDAGFGLNPDAVPALVTPRTRAILAVHTYGQPCQLEALAEVAREHKLTLIYDAAHAFGLQVEGKGIANFGDLSTFSFHATKGFNTLEGGCVAGPSSSSSLLDRVALERNFGIVSPDEVTAFGRNGKMDEVRAAIGLLTLPRVQAMVTRRREVTERYLAWFRERNEPELGINWDFYERDDLVRNYSYFPVRVEPRGRRTRDAVCKRMEARKIIPRKYFYPAVTTSPLYRELCDPADLPETERAARSVLCLPLHHGLSDHDVERILSAFEDALEHLD